MGVSLSMTMLALALSLAPSLVLAACPGAWYCDCAAGTVPFPPSECRAAPDAATAAIGFLAGSLPPWDAINAASLGFPTPGAPDTDGLNFGIVEVLASHSSSLSSFLFLSRRRSERNIVRRGSDRVPASIRVCGPMWGHARTTNGTRASGAPRVARTIRTTAAQTRRRFAPRRERDARFLASSQP